MLSLKKRGERGFTIIELLIVIVVIGILATLVIVTYNGVQQKARDTKRKTDINALQGQVEAYNAQTGYYPTLANLNDTSAGGFDKTNLKGLDLSALADPTNPNTQVLVASPKAGAYAYSVTPTGCDNSSGNTCTAYTLTATLENPSGTTYVKSGSN